MDLPHTGIEPGSPTLQADSLPYGKPITVFKWPGFFLLLSAYFQSSSQKAFRTDFRGLISYSFPNLTVRYSEETLPTVWQGPLTSGFFFLLENFDFYYGQQIPSIAFLFKKIFIIGVYLLYNVVLVSASQQCESASYQFSSVTQSCRTLCDPMDCSTPVLPVYHQFPEFTQTHVH